MNVAPGPHRIDLRTYTQSSNGTGKWGPCQYEPTNAVWKANFGWAIDWKGMGSTNCADYAEIRDPGDGSLFTTTTNGMDEVLSSLVPKFDHLKFSGGTLDAYGSDIAVKTLECGGGSITNSNEYQANGTITVTESLRVDGSSYGGKKLAVYGKLKFAPRARLDFPDFDDLAHGEYVLVSAKDGIEGSLSFSPEGLSAKRWHLETGTAEDGSATILLNWRNGLSIQLR